MPLLFQNPGRRLVKQINGGQPQTRREAIALAFDLKRDRLSKALFRGCKAMPLTCLQTHPGRFWNSIKASSSFSIKLGKENLDNAIS